MSFKFIPNTNTSFVAGDADTLSSIDFGGIFKNQTRKNSFQIGNTGSGISDFIVRVSGSESDITDNVEYSLDGNTWQSEVAISGLEPNRISDLVQLRYTPDANDYTASGTFKIYVVEQ